MNSLARNFAINFAREALPEFGQTFTYTKVFPGKLDGEFVTLENYSNGRFGKHINNTGDIFGDGSELSMKSESFVHNSYVTVASAKQLMIADIQGVNYSLSDPEIASSTLMAMDDTILFCTSQQQLSISF